MAPESKMTRLALPAGCMLLGAAVLAAVFVLWPAVRPGARLNPLGATADLYAKASGQDHERLDARMEAARLLVKQPDADPWIVLLLLSPQVPPKGDEIEQARQKDLHRFELAVVAPTIKSLPPETGPSVLWALTLLLDEIGRGSWSESSFFVDRNCGSRPIREMARDYLKKRLGVDCGWEASAWRAAIAQYAVEMDGQIPAQGTAEDEMADR